MLAKAPLHYLGQNPPAHSPQDESVRTLSVCDSWFLSCLETLSSTGSTQLWGGAWEPSPWTRYVDAEGQREVLLSPHVFSGPLTFLHPVHL